MLEESRLGVDYLVDWYAVLGVARDAEVEVIRTQCRALQHKYHPDRYERLAEEYKEAAGKRFVILTQAANVLLDADSRAAYDALLAEWKGPLSTNGHPIIVIGGPRMSPMRLLDANGEEAQREMQEKARQFSGFDEKTYRLLERLMSLPKPDAETVEAYREALRRRSVSLELQEAFLWEAAGFADRPIDNQAPRAYLARVEEDVRAAREAIVPQVVSTLLALEGREVKLLGSGGESTDATFDQSMVEQKRECALTRFDEVTALIRDKAVERQEVIEKRLDLLTGQYAPEQPQRFPRLVVVLTQGGVDHLFPFRLKEVTAGEVPTIQGLNQLAELGIDASIVEANVETLNAHGLNVIYLPLEEGIDILAQVTEVVTKHFEPFLPKEEETPETS